MNILKYCEIDFNLVGRHESNVRPHDPKPRALPTEPRPEIYKFVFNKAD